jgi:hypothetical protein
MSALSRSAPATRSISRGAAMPVTELFSGAADPVGTAPFLNTPIGGRAAKAKGLISGQQLYNEL